MSVVAILQAAAKDQRDLVLNMAELAINAAEEALHRNDRMLAKEKYEEAASNFSMAGQVTWLLSCFPFLSISSNEWILAQESTTRSSSPE